VATKKQKTKPSTHPAAGATVVLAVMTGQGDTTVRLLTPELADELDLDNDGMLATDEHTPGVFFNAYGGSEVIREALDYAAAQGWTVDANHWEGSLY
jgi:hypothetical protein